VTEEGINPAEVAATGKGGRITKGDVLAHLETPKTAPLAQPGTKSAPEFKAPVAKAPQGRGERREPMSMLRRRIAERLVHAQSTAAILTTFNEVDMKAVMDLRKQYKDAFKERHGVGLGFMSFFVKAAVEALKSFPAINGWIDGNDIVYHDYYDIGVAVSSDRGLVVPVLRDVDQLDMAGIEKAIVHYGQKARDGKITIDDLSGGTFTISNGGVFGSLLSTPILNPPQSAILGMHKIEERPMALNGAVVIRPMMYLALSYDHRIVDGKEAVQFLVKIKELVEDPTRLLLGV
jgi:2-oxoglutarate dehydrogenase E2 component (dihydrolipoamide succinyltransferase)